MSKENSSKEKLAFIILIGGKSARFGSDKGLFKFKEKPLISYQLETLSSFNRNIFLVARSHQQVQAYIDKIDIEKIMAFIIDDKELIDDESLYSPMIGIYSGLKELERLEYEKAFIFSCDIPLIKIEIIDLLLSKSEDNDCCIPKWNNGFLEPLFAIYPVKEAFIECKKNLKNKSYKLTNILNKNWKINYISIEDSIQALDEKLITFININGPIDIEKLIKFYDNN